MVEEIDTKLNEPSLLDSDKEDTDEMLIDTSAKAAAPSAPHTEAKPQQ